MITALELGPRLALTASRNLAAFPRAPVLVADFDRRDVAPRAFDVVVAATAFHWLDAATRVGRCTRALAPGGTLVVVETHGSGGSGADGFFTACQECYARRDPHHDPGWRPADRCSMRGGNDELESSGLFEEVRLEELVHERRYGAAAYSDLVATFSDVLRWPRRARAGLLECIRHLIDARWDGVVARKDLYRTWFARAPRV